MTLLEAVFLLKDGGVAPALYKIGGLGGGENVGIRYTAGAWEVFFNERGYADDIETFAEEEAAVACFLARLDEHAKAYNHGVGIFPPV